MHTELCTDGFLDLYNAGKLTNKRKNIFPGQGRARSRDRLPGAL